MGLEVSLFHRTTRCLELTEDGQTYISVIPVLPPIETRIDLCYCKGHTLSPIAKHFVSCVSICQEKSAAPSVNHESIH
ncbi:hypothetical protein [Eisenbergiella porci]|uniref:hypothetical protein n=1 Tax=Eisenbergiella TaxID=1432051 RepID=UPI003A8FE2BB